MRPRWLSIAGTACVLLVAACTTAIKQPRPPASDSYLDPCLTSASKG